MEVAVSLVFVILFILCTIFCHLFYEFWLKPEICRRKLGKQGIKGPPISNIFGHIPEMKTLISKMSATPTLDSGLTMFPYFNKWTKDYGKLFRFALGKIQILYVANPEMVRELRVHRALDLGKPAYLQNERGALLGKGLITTNGAVWSHQRKTIAPMFYMDKVKDMLDLMVESGNQMVKSWEEIVKNDSGMADITIDGHVRSFTSYIASKMVFGEDHHKGIKIFPKCQALIKSMGNVTTLGLPLARLIPKKSNREAQRLAKEIHHMIMAIARERDQSNKPHKDTLQGILEGSKDGEFGSLTKEEFVVDNCKDIFLAAYEVTAIAAIWGLLLLAANPEWQARARAEILDICGRQIPTYDMLNKMNVLKMIIREVLRLYPGVVFVSREAIEDVKLGELQVPRGVDIWIWMLALHRDPKLWGPDADKFNPERFLEGISGACKSPNAYIPFGLGSRICPGQNLAMLELKLLFAMILSNFSLEVSPNYRHSPQFHLLLVPEHNVNLIVQKI